MISKKAEERRQRFLKVKEKYSDINDLIKEQVESDVHVIFDD